MPPKIAIYSCIFSTNQNTRILEKIKVARHLTLTGINIFQVASNYRINANITGIFFFAKKTPSPSPPPQKKKKKTKQKKTTTKNKQTSQTLETDMTEEEMIHCFATKGFLVIFPIVMSGHKSSIWCSLSTVGL